MAAKPNSDGDNTLRDLLLPDAAPRSDLLLLDVTPLSLGIEITGKLMSVVIPRNTPIPTKETQIYQISYENAMNYREFGDIRFPLRMKVFQGERTKSTDNYLLGRFTVSGIPVVRNQRFEVCFEIDANGILKVRTKVLSTGTREKITIITNLNDRLSKKKIEKMIEDANKYKREDKLYKRNWVDMMTEYINKYKLENEKYKLEDEEWVDKWTEYINKYKLEDEEYKLEDEDYKTMVESCNLSTRRKKKLPSSRNLSAFGRYIKNILFA